MDAALESKIDAYINEVWDDVLSDIAALVSHPSVADASQAAPGAPFGASTRSALDCALDIAERLGYQTGDDEGYVGFADIPGERTEQIATIAHVDVVPAGTGWNTDPFTMERRDGWLLGRGVIDDKGPAVLSLYAGAFLLHEGITPRYTFRALLGCDEECGMTDVHHYLATHENPAFLFTPDAEFPLCNAEKGCYGATFMSAPIKDGRIISWSGAEVTNAIPGESVLELAIDASELPAPRAHAERIAIEAVRPGVSRITATGIGGHASLPEGTLNAIGLVVDYLREAEVLEGEEARFLELLACVHADTAGEALGRNHPAAGNPGRQVGQTAVELPQQRGGGAGEAVFGVAQLPHQDGQVPQLGPEPLHGAEELFGIGFQLFGGQTVALPLVPQDGPQPGGAHGQPGLEHRMVKEDLPRLPLGDGGAPVGAGDQAHLPPFFGEGRRKAGRQTGPAAGTGGLTRNISRIRPPW